MNKRFAYLGVSVVLVVLVLLSPQRNLTANLLLLLVQVFAIVDTLFVFLPMFQVYIKQFDQRLLKAIYIVYPILASLGLWFGRLNSPFSLPIPFFYYILLALLLFIQLILAIDGLEYPEMKTDTIDE